MAASVEIVCRAPLDERRDRKLPRQGYRVLRIDAELVRLRPEEAVALARAAVEASGSISTW